MNDIEISILIQKELDRCNEKIKKYDSKYKPEKKEKIEILYTYLNEHLENYQQYESETEDNDLHKKLLLDDIKTLSMYIDLID